MSFAQPSRRSGAARLARAVGLAIVVLIVTATMAASWIAPNAPDAQFADRALAPPTRIHLRDAEGWRAPFLYPLVIVDRLARTFREDRDHPIAARWFTGGALVSADAAAGPVLLLGGDSLGRDVFARLLYGARVSLGVVSLAVCGAIGLGLVVGGVAGLAGGRTERVLMWAADFLLVLPGAYLVLVLRGTLPLVLPWQATFVLMTGLLSVVSWPHVARGVRAIVAIERTREYVEAARAAGAGPWRVLWHVLPAARGFLIVEIVLLVPALLVAEVTLSLLGLGFAEPVASWGTMLQEAQNVRLLAEAPWVLAPAAAIFVFVLGVHLAGRGPQPDGV